jgi:hypothetical protein
MKRRAAWCFENRKPKLNEVFIRSAKPTIGLAN